LVEAVPQRNGLAFYQECREGTTIVSFKGTTSAQKEKQLFRSKEQQVRKRKNNCSVQRNSRRAKGTTIVPFKGRVDAQNEQQLFVQRNNRCTKGTTIVPFKGTTGTQKEQQLLGF
jgi:hypothetical protein